MGVWLLFFPVLALMYLQTGVMRHQKRIMQEMRDDLGRVKTQLWVLSVAMDAANEKLGEQITEHVEASVIKAQDEAAEAAELEQVITADTHRTVLDEAA